MTRQPVDERKSKIITTDFHGGTRMVQHISNADLVKLEVDGKVVWQKKPDTATIDDDSFYGYFPPPVI